MSKEIVKQAISETIVSNNKKGISAQSLSNVLNLMVDEGGSGAVMVKLGAMIDGSLLLTSSDKEYNREIFDICKNAAQNGELCPIVTFDYLALVASTEPEAAALLGSSQLLFFPMICGYIEGALAAEELGYSEVIYVASMIGLQLILLSDGNVILQEN